MFQWNDLLKESLIVIELAEAGIVFACPPADTGFTIKRKGYQTVEFGNDSADFAQAFGVGKWDPCGSCP